MRRTNASTAAGRGTFSGNSQPMDTMSQAHVEDFAHHWILLAGPAFLPAVIVVGVVLYVALRDRRKADRNERPEVADKPK
ncbi:hypothetical protein JMUB5695_02728 [Mycobacterium heckeshornense]|uniref:Uncharacterized protein n=2 Tax=Mycobacterium heckeshornense TaxID=110505 RepID=A0A7R7YS33_9MYCO|nr:hypothetical protein MHEC_25680 [Mycobacterium heckeshornense]BCQ09284.1 hypothetical protein JMUB5695_02728 [Mycobacterium heckeshornense]